MKQGIEVNRRLHFILAETALNVDDNHFHQLQWRGLESLSLPLEPTRRFDSATMGVPSFPF